VPRTIDDIQFTRDGDFHFEFLPGSLRNPDGTPVDGVGTYRLVNKDGMFVQGYNSPVVENIRPFGTPPEESQGTDLEALSTITVPDAPGQNPRRLILQNIQLDLARNPSAANQISFDPQGLVHVGGVEPRDLANNPANMYVALTKFANQQGLDRSGGGAYFSYDVVAGEMFTGVAGVGNDGRNRVVGATNTLTPGAIENSNTSINTTMPEITLAQKSFSAATKVISVGNTMIDDANQLVK
jgi:flagellar hook protein FlgE